MPLGFPGLARVRRQRREHLLQLAVALGHLLGVGVVQGHRQLEGEQMLLAPVALQGLRRVRRAGADVAVLELGEGLPVALATQDRPDDLQPRLAGHVGDDLAELDVHLRQRLLHVLSASQPASRSRSTVKLGNSRTCVPSRSGGTATKWLEAPMSMPAALGWVNSKTGLLFDMAVLQNEG